MHILPHLWRNTDIFGLAAAHPRYPVRKDAGVPGVAVRVRPVENPLAVRECGERHNGLDPTVEGTGVDAVRGAVAVSEDGELGGVHLLGETEEIGDGIVDVGLLQVRVDLVAWGAVRGAEVAVVVEQD